MAGSRADSWVLLLLLAASLLGRGESNRFWGLASPPTSWVGILAQGAQGADLSLEVL